MALRRKLPLGCRRRLGQSPDRREDALSCRVCSPPIPTVSLWTALVGNHANKKKKNRKNLQRRSKQATLFISRADVMLSREESWGSAIAFRSDSAKAASFTTAFGAGDAAEGDPAAKRFAGGEEFAACDEIGESCETIRW